MPTLPFPSRNEIAALRARRNAEKAQLQASSPNSWEFLKDIPKEHRKTLSLRSFDTVGGVAFNFSAVAGGGGIRNVPFHNGFTILEVLERMVNYKDRDGKVTPIPRIYLVGVGPDYNQKEEVEVPRKLHRANINKGKQGYHKRIQKRWNKRYGVVKAKHYVLVPQVWVVSPGHWRKMLETGKLAAAKARRNKDLWAVVEVQKDPNWESKHPSAMYQYFIAN